MFHIFQKTAGKQHGEKKLVKPKGIQYWGDRDKSKSSVIRHSDIILLLISLIQNMQINRENSSVIKFCYRARKSWQDLVITLGVKTKLIDPHFDYNFGE